MVNGSTLDQTATDVTCLAVTNTQNQITGAVRVGKTSLRFHNGGVELQDVAQDVLNTHIHPHAVQQGPELYAHKEKLTGLHWVTPTVKGMPSRDS